MANGSKRMHLLKFAQYMFRSVQRKKQHKKLLFPLNTINVPLVQDPIHSLH